MSKTKILFVINGFGAGGAERQLTYLTIALKARGFLPTIVTVYDAQTVPYHSAYTQELAANDIPIVSLSHGHGIGGRLQALCHYQQLMRDLRPKLVQGFMHYANLITRIMRPFCPSHYLLTSARSTFSSGEMRSERLTAWLDDGIVTNNQDVQKSLTQQAARRLRKTHYIPNGVALNRFDLPEQADLLRQSIGGAFIIGMIGRIMWKKDHLTLLKALTMLDENTRSGLHTFLLGNVDDYTLYQQLNEYIQHHQLLSIVSRWDATENIVPYYHAADITVLSSVEEGFPNVVLESLAAGRPIIVSDMANKSQVVQHGINGWVFPARDSGALAECIRLARQQTPEQKTMMRENARQSVQSYGIDAVADQFVALYTTLLER